MKERSKLPRKMTHEVLRTILEKLDSAIEKLDKMLEATSDEVLRGPGPEEVKKSHEQNQRRY